MQELGLNNLKGVDMPWIPAKLISYLNQGLSTSYLDFQNGWILSGHVSCIDWQCSFISKIIRIALFIWNPFSYYLTLR